jgi:tripartite-type tricarboxylate transporter receptor subunit TctC
MKRTFTQICRTGFIAAAAAPLAAFAGTGSDYPTKPVRFVVGFAPGGGSDTAARGLANVLTGKWGQQVDNRPGASGTIAADITVNAVPDGHTLLLGTIALVVNPHLVAKMPFDTLRDLTPVTRIADQTNILVVHPTVAAGSVKELIALARTKPLNAGSSGIGGAGHLAIALFNMQTGTSLSHVAYKGGGPAIVGLLGGDVHLIFATTASSIAHIKSGKAKALAVTTLKRSALVPDLPTLDESGLKGFEANNWNGLFVTSKTPRALVTRLNQDLVAALSTPELKEQMFRQGLDAAPESPEAFAAYCKAEYAKWAKVVKAAGIKPQ